MTQNSNGQASPNVGFTASDKGGGGSHRAVTSSAAKLSSVGLSLGLLFLADSAVAQTTTVPAGFVQADMLTGVQTVTELPSRALELTMMSGDVVVIPAASAQVVGGVAFVTEAAAASQGLALAAGTAAAGGFGGTGLLLAGVAGASGVAVSLASNGSEDAPNIAPVFSSSSSASAEENQTSAYTATATDADVSTTLTYSISGADAALFNIDSATGVVTFKDAPDFETPSDAGGDNVYDIIVTVTDGTDTAEQAVAITVTDQNDNAPVFTSEATASVSENQTAAYTAAVTDADAGSTFSFSLSGADAALFDIDAVTGVVTFKVVPDFENPNDAGANNVYDIVVTASDGTNSTDQAVAITVTDQNDNAPIFTSGATATAAENQLTAYTAVTTDADGSDITYSLSGTDAALFDVAANGVVTFKVAPDFETPGDAGGNNVYDIVVTASDGVSTTDQAVAITVTDQNDNNPVFTSGAAATVAENTTAATIIYTANATDTDTIGTVTYALSGADAALFNIDSMTGVVTFNASPDFEAPGDVGGNNVYDIVVTATDGVNATDQAVAITVTGVNDSAPVFTSGVIATAAENQTAAYTATATDADTGETLSYALSGADAALFDIDSTTGVVTFKAAPDFEAPSDTGADNVYNVVVTANDGVNTTDQAVAITVTDQNDIAPVLTAGAAATVAENTAAATPVYTASATDTDTVGTVSYALSGADAVLFNIDSTTGVVTFKTAPDFETPGDVGGDNIYDVVVTASDGVNSADQAVAITVTDQNDNAPVFNSPTVSIRPEGTDNFAYQASATDADTNSTLTYSLSGVDVAAFDIDSVTGRVTFKNAADFETPADVGGDNTYNLVITVGDGVNSTSQNFTVNITDVNDNSPVFFSGSTANAAENQTVAYTAMASDRESGASVTFTLSGTDAALFDIDITTGVVTFKNAPDFENPRDTDRDGVYDFIVTARDGFVVSPSDVNTTDQAVSVIVTDVFDIIAPIQLSSLGAAGFRIDGVSTSGLAGSSVSNAGDVNGDGFDDFIIGALRADPNGTSGAGSSYLIFGSANPSQMVLNLDDLGSAGFRINGVSQNDLSGRSVSSAGDVNGDGFDDLIIGATGVDSVGSSSDSGSSYVIFGSAGTEQPDIDLGSLGASGFRIDGAKFGDFSGISVSSAGDVNGDGFDDLIIGALFADPRDNFNSGSSYVIFGSAGTAQADIDLNDLGALGFRIDGAFSNDNSGRSVSGAGDVNGDGFDDLIIGASEADPGGNSRAGSSYVIFGSGGASQADIDLSDLGSAGFRIDGVSSQDNSGLSVSGVGDVNGDGFDDLVIGAFGVDPSGHGSAGASYVVFGSAGAAQRDIDLGNLGEAGFQINGGSTNFGSGFSVSGAGDVNGDGFDDLIVGAPHSNGRSGLSYVIFGSAGASQADIDLGNLGTSGFRIEAVGSFDLLGQSVSGAGDVNGDGFDDLIVGAPQANFNDGSSFIIYGGRTGSEDTTAVTATGTAAVDNFTGNAGNDTFTSIGTNDVVRGGAGDDSITVTGLDYADIRGGTGIDTLTLDGAGLSLNLTTVSSAGLVSIEIIDLTGTGDNSLTLDARGVFQLTEERSGGTATLTVQGNAGDGVTLQGAFVQGLQVVDGGITYTVYTDGNAVARVQDGVGVSTVGASRLTDISGDGPNVIEGLVAAEAAWDYRDGIFEMGGSDYAPAYNPDTVLVESLRPEPVFMDEVMDALTARDMFEFSHDFMPLFESLSVDLDASIWNDLGEHIDQTDGVFEDLSVDQAAHGGDDDAGLFDALSVESASTLIIQQVDPADWFDPELQIIVDELVLFTDDGHGLAPWVASDSA